MADGKILNHPDKETIIKKLCDGVSPNLVLKWLQEKYPEDKQYHITIATLSNFRKDYLNLNREAVRILKKERQKRELNLPYNPNISAFIERTNESEEEHALRVKNTLFQSATYRDKLKEITDAHIDAPKLIKELHTLLNSRIEVYYNEVASKEKMDVKEDRMFLDYIRLATEVAKDFKKVWSDYNSQPDEGTINLNVVHEQVGIIREVVKDLLAEFSPELALEFMDKLNAKLSNLKYEVRSPPDIKERVERLNQRIKDIQEKSGGN